MDEENPLENYDRRNNTILVVVGILLLLISLYSLFSGTELLPTMWGELSVILVLGILYNWAIRNNWIDLRLGLVYSAIGILVSFVILTIGFLLSILVLNVLPFLAGSRFSILTLTPFGICALILRQYLHRISLKETEQQWTKMNEEIMLNTTLQLDPVMLHLAKKKWTDLWFYIILYTIIELMPIMLRTADIGISAAMSVLLIVLFMLQLFEIYRVLKRGRIQFTERST